MTYILLFSCAYLKRDNEGTVFKWVHIPLMLYQYIFYIVPIFLFPKFLYSYISEARSCLTPCCCHSFISAASLSSISTPYSIGIYCFGRIVHISMKTSLMYVTYVAMKWNIQNDLKWIYIYMYIGILNTLCLICDISCELCNQGYIREPLRWGTNEIRLERVTKGNQWDGGPMRWGTYEHCVTRVTLGDQWDREQIRTVYPGLR